MSSTTVECWRCETENNIVYGGVSYDIFRCENCNEVIAWGDRDSLGIATDKSEAGSILHRYEESISEENDCNHPVDYITPLTLNRTDYSIKVKSFMCLQCGEEMETREIMEEGIWS